MPMYTGLVIKFSYLLHVGGHCGEKSKMGL